MTEISREKWVQLFIIRTKHWTTVGKRFEYNHDCLICKRINQSYSKVTRWTYIKLFIFSLQSINIAIQGMVMSVYGMFQHVLVFTDHFQSYLNIPQSLQRNENIWISRVKTLHKANINVDRNYKIEKLLILTCLTV